MNRILILLVFCCIGRASFGQELDASVNFIRRYDGKIGKYPISLTLQVFNGDISGKYGYLKKGKQPAQWLTLTGHLERDGSISLTEANTQAVPTGFFKGQTDAKLAISGEWQKPDGSQKLPFTLKPIANNSKQAGWLGGWYRNEPYTTGTLLIGNITATSFEFVLDFSSSGVFWGYLADTAFIRGTEASSFNDDLGICTVHFKLLKGKIHIEAGNISGCGFGEKAYPDGNYENHYTAPNPDLSGVFKDPAVDEKFRALTGKAYAHFYESMMVTSTASIDDTYITHGETGGVPGMYGIMEAIICWNDKGLIWAAVIQLDVENGDKIIYYTNDPAHKKDAPLTIKNWAGNFNYKFEHHE